MNDDNTRSRPDGVDEETPDDVDEETRVVDRGADDESTRLVCRGAVEEHTCIVERTVPAEDHTRRVERPLPASAPVAIHTETDDAEIDGDETQIAWRPERFGDSGRITPAPADQSGIPGLFRLPEVQNGATESYGIRRMPPAAAPLRRPRLAPAPAVTLQASPAQLRDAAATRNRRRRWRTLVVATTSTVLVAGAAVIGIVALIGT